MDNPLKQYFRRPALFLKLPSHGNFYPEGSVDMPANGELPIYPMTAIDEITSRTPDALFNGSALVDIIKSCVPNIKNPWDIPTMDLDPILISIRAATNTNEMDVDSTCPACGEESKYKVNLIGLLTNLRAGDYQTELELNELKFKFKPLSYKKINDINIAQFQFSQEVRRIEQIENEEQRVKETNATMVKMNELGISLVVESIESVTTPNTIVTEKAHILDFLKSCDRNTFNTLREKSVSLRTESELKPLQVKCVACSHEYKQALTLNVTDFFD